MIDIRQKTAQLVRENVNLPEDATQVLFDLGLLEMHTCRKVLIRNEYYRKCATRRKTDLKIYLAEKYCVSLSTINKYLALDS
jgi:hypothetical protein